MLLCPKCRYAEADVYTRANVCKIILIIFYIDDRTLVSGKSYNFFANRLIVLMTNKQIITKMYYALNHLIFYRIQWLLEQTKDDGKDKITFCDFYMHVHIIGNMKY